MDTPASRRLWPSGLVLVLLSALLLVGCGGDRRNHDTARTGQAPAATRPSEGVLDAGSMVEEDARRLEPVTPAEPPPRRPDPVRRPTRPFVDQPRFR